MIRDNILINAGIQTGMLDETRVAELKLVARRERSDLLTLLCYRLRFSITSLYRAYAQVQDIRFLDSDEILIDPLLLRKISPAIVQRRLMLPLLPIEETALLLVDNPDDIAGIAQVRRSLPDDIEICMTDPRLLEQLVQRVMQSASEDEGEEADEFDPVAGLNELLTEAYLNSASDVHFEPSKGSFHIRFRIDGCLQPYAKMLTVEQGAAMLSRMKVLTSMDISEQRMPQDGGMTFELDKQISFDIRAATIPIKFGERATLRLLGSDSEALSLKKIGLSERSLALFSEAIKRPHGMILITGPTGSGKSTTLYSALQQIANKDINVLTVEDPIEYVMDGISQVQVGAKVSFSSALRSFLRHDPDVIMVGEIRDGETAGIAMKAALTGHMVFSTLHTKLLRISSVEKATVYQNNGCSNCHNSGYKGRIALFETLWMDENLARIIARGGSDQEIRNNAKDFVSLADDCREKILAGQTTIEEFERLSLGYEESINEPNVIEQEVC
jgi:type IV pilus assembly protein PilB